MSFIPTPATVHFLLSATGQTWLSRAEELPLTPASHLTDVQKLRKNLSAEQAAAVAEQVLLRRRGAEKFIRAGDMLFLRDALEQATRESLAQHRAARFAPFATVAEIGCGIGGDTIALAQAVAHVFALDLDALRLKFALHNAGVYNTREKIRFIQANGVQPPFQHGTASAIFADPARRSSAGKRTFDPRHYQPPLNTLMETFDRLPLGIKLAPGIDYVAIPDDAEIEIISFRGEAKEAVLWRGALVTAGVSRRATLLPAGLTLTDAADEDSLVVPPGTFIFEPDAAVIRAGLVRQIAAKLGLHLLDEKIAYLTGDRATTSPWGASYQIEAQLPLKMKVINQYLKTHRIARVNIKQRGSGLRPEAISKKIKTAKTGTERTLILTRVKDTHLAFVCHYITKRKEVQDV